MYLYSHLALAQLARKRLQPAFMAEYAWGVILPDIYGMAGIPRAQTHLTWGQMESLLIRYPDHRSFLQGYRVHLYLDQIDVVKMVSLSFPVAQCKSLFARYLAPQVIDLLVEDYMIRSISHRDIPAFSGRYNPILSHFGFAPELAAEYARNVQAYIANHSIKKICLHYDRLGLHGPSGDGRCPRDYRLIKENVFLSMVMLLAIKRAGLEKIALGFM